MMSTVIRRVFGGVVAASAAGFVGVALAAEPPVSPVPPPAPPAAPVATAFDYVLDGGRSDLYVQADKDPSSFASALAHDHVVQATAWRGTVHWDAANVGACRIDISVPVGNLRNDDPAFRKKLGYTTEPSGETRDEIRLAMHDKGQLNLAAFPDIKYVSSRCESSGDLVNVTGTLTIRGVGAAVMVPMKVVATSGDFAASGKFTVNTTAFGFQPYTAFGGAVKVLNALRFTVDVKGHVK